MADLQTEARKILLDHGAIEACEVHKDVYLDNGDPEAVSKVFAAAAEMVKAGEIETTREKFTDAINAALSEAVEECPKCAGDEG